MGELSCPRCAHHPAGKDGVIVCMVPLQAQARIALCEHMAAAAIDHERKLSSLVADLHQCRAALALT